MIKLVHVHETCCSGSLTRTKRCCCVLVSQRSQRTCCAICSCCSRSHSQWAPLTPAALHSIHAVPLMFLVNWSAGLTTAWTTVRKMSVSRAPTPALSQLMVTAMTEVLALNSVLARAILAWTVRTAARGPLGRKVARVGQQGLRPATRRPPPQHRLPPRPPPQHRLPPRRPLASATSARS